MKKAQKIIRILMIMMFVLVVISTMVSAVDFDPGNISAKEVSGVSDIKNIGGQIITVVTTVGSVASVIVLVVLGLKYMMGSAEEKAEYKKTLMPYVIGAGMVFAASSIAGVIYSFTNELG